MSEAKKVLYDYQADAIERLKNSLRSGKRRPVLQAPTGYGKTVVAAAIVEMAREKKTRVVFCVPAVSLIDQTLEMFWREGIANVGVIQADHINTDWSRPVQVASVQTLARRPYPEAGLVIIDECHRLFQHYTKWMSEAAWQRVPFIGLSATPWTKGLGKIFDDLIISATTADLIKLGKLSPFRAFAPSHPDLSSVSTVAGEYHQGQLSNAMSRPKLVADVVQTWIEKGEGRPTLCFAVDRAHAKRLQQDFLAAGIACGYQDMKTSLSERAQIKRDFHAGRIPVVCNVGTLTTGVDWDVRCISMARPTKSEMLYVQIIGRGLRTAPGKSDCLILDHSDNTERLGLVTNIVHDTLDDGETEQKAERKVPLPKPCPECSFILEPGVNPCPNCSHRRKPPVSKIVNEAGSLKPVTSAKASRPGYVVVRGREVSHADLFGELRYFALSKGYAVGWAARKYRELIGNWPTASFQRGEAIPTSYEVLAWIKAGQQAWARRQSYGRARAAANTNAGP